MPAGVPHFPAIILMHGCSGLWRADGKEPTPHHLFWARKLCDQGYLTLLVDSFGPRGAREIYTHKVRAISPDRDRTADAYASLLWLARRQGPVRWRAEVRNPASAGGWGATVGSHPEARAASVKRTLEWLGGRHTSSVPRGTKVGSEPAFP